MKNKDVKPIMKNLRRLVENMGGQIVDESSGRWNVYQIEPPEGMEWNDAPECSAIKLEWPAGTIAKYKAEEIRDAINRVNAGLAEVQP